MSKFKNAIINTHNEPDVTMKVLVLLRDNGYVNRTAEPNMEQVLNRNIVCGRWHSHNEDNEVLWSHSHSAHIEQHPDWPAFDAKTQWEELVRFIRGEPEFDETSLPNHTSMTPEREDEVRLQFNLSPEQWEMLTPRAKEALGGARVEVVQSEHEWIPISQRPRNSDSLLLTNNPRMAASNARSCTATGYYYAEEWMVIHGPPDLQPTHWCAMPGSNADDE